ncbi:MAG: DnaJ domain-containing protein [Acidobacteria bacterium]|nr:DnaJ domain-containing protein [Acidobacteriota bacterium]
MSLLETQNPYKVLGIERGATEAEIKRAYFTLVREHPPERDPEGFKRIRAAYEKLRSERERAETDLFLIDDRQIDVDPWVLKMSERPAKPEGMETILADLIALEAGRLLERLRHQGEES